MNLPHPARYFPIDKGIYEVAPGLRSLGQGLGPNPGPHDALVFQLDSEFPKYRKNKIDCRNERLSKYYCEHSQSPAVTTAVNRFLLKQISKEHPKFFEIRSGEDTQGRKTLVLLCKLTDEVLTFDESNMNLLEQKTALDIPYVSSFDALCSQVQEDIAVTSRNSEQKDWLSSIHLCSAAHWSAEDKVGKSFFDIHLPVAGIEKINRAAASFVDAMIRKGPYVRFVWGFGTDDRLNHHPIAPVGIDPAEWKGRTFLRSREGSPFILRVERQVLWGLPEVDASVFMIRTSFIDGEEIRNNPIERANLRSGLLSMTAESRKYKGLDQCMDEVIQWIDEASEA